MDNLREIKCFWSFWVLRKGKDEETVWLKDVCLAYTVEWDNKMSIKIGFNWETKRH